MATASSAARKPANIDPRRDMLIAVDAVAKRGGITRDRAITAWYASSLLGIDEDEAIDAASVDGPEDGGADFIYIDHDQEIVYVLQGYVSDRPERTAGLKKWNPAEQLPKKSEVGPERILMKLVHKDAVSHAQP